MGKGLGPLLAGRGGWRAKVLGWAHWDRAGQGWEWLPMGPSWCQAGRGALWAHFTCYRDS